MRVGQVGTEDSLQVRQSGQVFSKASRKTIILGLYSISTVQVAFSELPLNKGVL